MIELVGKAEIKTRKYGVIDRQRIAHRVSQNRRQNKLLAMAKRLINIIRTKSLSEPDFPETQGWHTQDERTKSLWAIHSQTHMENPRSSFDIFR